ncbi:MAG: prepilin-type N-terminal cleavage/methylation domain-containing protein [Betaproteobacteria bacterium]
MQFRREKSPIRNQRGFSMVEMLMTAFILAVGIMGLTLLQVMALKGARGGSSLSTAIQVAEDVLDRVELEGRLTWLNISATQLTTAGALNNLQYVNKTALDAPLVFTIKGRAPDADAQDAVDSTAFYSVTMTRSNDTAVSVGMVSDFTVTVSFSDVVNPTNNQPIIRNVRLSRRVLHG